MSKSVFRFFNPNAPKEDPIQKRRGQLRRAQRSYRDRKERYPKLLEGELVQTRTNEANLMRECEDLRAKLQNALTLLSQHGIQLPPEPLGLPLQTSLESSVDPLGLPLQGLGDDFLWLQETSPLPQLSSPESFGTNAHSEPQEDPLPLVRATRNTLWPADTGGGTRVCEMDQITVGMEFVLKIEEPCLGHLHGDPEKPDEPNGHALTVSAQLLCASSRKAPTVYESQPSPPTSYSLFQNAPAAMLERLLSLAPDLSADGEITPVQAWNSIRSRPQFGGLDIGRMRALGENLRKAVKCHGFGAVVPKNVFDGLVYDTLMLGQSF